MNKDALQKEIDRLRDEKNHFWNTLVVLVGSSIALLLSISLQNLLKFILFDVFKFILAVIGFYLSYLFLNGYFYKDSQIMKNIDKLNKQEGAK